MKYFDYPGKTNTGNFSRRRFISSCAACGACIAAVPLTFSQNLFASANNDKKLKISILYSLSGPVHTLPRAWPNIGFDFTPAMKQINSALTNHFRDFEFSPEMVSGPEEAEKIVAREISNPVDGYIVFQMELWNKVVQTVAKTGKPVLYADFAYGGSGGWQRYTAAFLREGTPNIGFISSFSMKDLLSAVDCFKIIRKGGDAAMFAEATRMVRLKGTPPIGKFKLTDDSITSLSTNDCIRRLSNSKIVAIRDQKAETAEPIMGIPLQFVPFSELDAAWSKADREEAVQLADQWGKKAVEIVNVTKETLVSSAAMYIAMKSLLKKYEANAITINCLGGFTGEFIHAYPCLGFHELNNEGLVGACECDIRSTATMLAFSTMTNGRPGFISDPVIDTSKRQIIYAHCVAPTKVFGPQGKTNPFTIMTHSEDRKGASIRSILPLHYLTTTLEIRQVQKEILFHQAVAVDNSKEDRACRTKLCAEVTGDMEKLLTQWDLWGWHRVTFYGDLKDPVYSLADAMGWNVVEEA
jgi:hypothetical protein